MYLGKGKRVRMIVVMLIVFAAVVIGVLVIQDGSVAAAELAAGKSGTAYNYNIGKGSDGKYYVYKPGTVRFAANDIRSGGRVYTGYCVNFYDETWFGWPYEAKKKSASAKLSSNGRKWLPYVLIYGYQKGKASPVKGTNSNDYRAATEVMVWDFNEGWRTSATGKLKSDRAYKSIKGRPAAKIYKDMLKSIDSHISGPSFAKSKKKDAPVYGMTYSYSTGRYSVDLQDKRKANHFKAAAKDGLTIRRSGYKYAVSVKKAGTYTVRWVNDIKTGTKQPLLIWQSKSSVSARQGVATGATDDTAFYTKFRTVKNGKLKLIKKSENGTVKGFRIKVQAASGNNNGYNKTFTTDSDGVVTANIAPGKYKVTETLTAAQRSAGWKIQGKNPQTVTVKEGKTASVTFRNFKKPQEQKSGAKIVKTTNNDIGDLSGFRFRVYGNNGSRQLTAEQAGIKSGASAASGGEVTVDRKDLDELNKAAAEGKTGDMILNMTCEQPADEQSGPDADENGPEGDDEQPAVSKRQITCHLKKAGEQERTYEPDTEEGITASDFDHAGSAIITDEVFETDKEGLIAEDLDTGTYEVTEVMTGDQARRYREPAKEVFTLTSKEPVAEIRMENIEKKIDLTIVKTSDDDNIEGVPFTLAGKTAWGEEIEPVELVTDEKGEAFYEGLPAGEYTVTETADEETYLPVEPQTFTADEDDVVLAFHNSIDSRVEVSKESATTGKELPGASMTVRDAETGETVEEWTSSDKPYILEDLEYGHKYILHEDLAPIGYTTASDIEFTAGYDEKVTMIDEVTRTTFVKKDADTGEMLAGAVIHVIDPKTKKTVKKFTTEKKQGSVIEMLEEGKKYTAREVEAPEGYELAGDVEFTAGKDTEVIMKDTKKKPVISVPATGDSSGKLIGALVLIMIICVSGFYALYRGSVRKNP
ncbi:MAG: SpaA isopeptide-forming pilin-related protein [Bacillota bacterium]|nr:SpaA isopeptide-forming pilin-related protein [Bacillota bacterium]